MNDEMTIQELVGLLRANPTLRCILQVRHAERPQMDPTDPTFGDALKLTDEGCRTAKVLGEIMRDLKDVVTFYSSPLTRTRMTAELIAAGMGIGDAAISTDERLGNQTFYYADPAQVLEMFGPAKFFNSCFEYYRTGHLRGFHELHAASEKLEAWLLERLTTRVLVATTHDCYIAAYLAAQAGMVFTRENWPRFLDGGALILSPGGEKRYALVRAGLSTGICGVGGKVL